jgi:hypothetical protein
MLVNHFGTKQASIAQPVGVRILFFGGVALIK